MSFDGVKLGLCALGAFYAFAGHVATRAALTSHFVDRAIAAIEGKQVSRIERLQSYWLLSAATLVLASGVTLLFLGDIAAWLFLASAAGQAFYLFYLAPRYFDAEDPPDAGGRRRSINAFVIYLVAAALVLWALSAGKLTSWREEEWPFIALPAAVIAGHVGYVAWTIAGAPACAPANAFAGPRSDAKPADMPDRDPSKSTRIKVMADYYTHPLWAIDDDLFGDFPPEQLALTAELTRDLNAWAEAYTSSLDPDDPAASVWSDAERGAHEAMARALAVRLAREKPDRRFYILEPDADGVVEVKADESI